MQKKIKRKIMKNVKEKKEKWTLTERCEDEGEKGKEDKDESEDQARRNKCTKQNMTKLKKERTKGRKKCCSNDCSPLV